MNSLAEIRRLFGLLTQEMEGVLASFENMSQQRDEIRHNEEVLKIGLTQLDEAKTQLASERQAYESERKFYLKSAAEQSLKESKLQNEQVKLDGIMEGIRVEKENLKKQEQDLELKIKLNIDIDQKLADISHREALIEKEKIIDRERKEMLDMREKELEAKAGRLQRIADNMGA